MKLVLGAIVAFMALGVVWGGGIAQAAPPRTPLHCAGTNSVWDDTDIVHLTINAGAGGNKISWRARGHTTLNCAGSPLDGQLVQIEQRVDARIGSGGALEGKAETRVSLGSRHHEFRSSYTGTTTVNNGILTLSALLDGANGGVWRFQMQDQGTINLRTRQFETHNIIGVLVDGVPVK